MSRIDDRRSKERVDTERRGAERLRVWMPVRVNGVRGGIAVLRDVSRTGAQIFTADTIHVGDSVHMTCTSLLGDSASTTGVVVRAGRNLGDRSGLWHFRAGVRFERPCPAMRAAIDGARRAVLACALRICVRDRVPPETLTLEAIGRELGAEAGEVGQYFTDSDAIASALVDEICNQLRATAAARAARADTVEAAVAVLVDEWCTGMVRATHWTGAPVDPSNGLLNAVTRAGTPMLLADLRARLEGVVSPTIGDDHIAEILGYAAIGLQHASRYASDYRRRLSLLVRLVLSNVGTLPVENCA